MRRYGRARKLAQACDLCPDLPDKTVESVCTAVWKALVRKLPFLEAYR